LPAAAAVAQRLGLRAPLPETVRLLADRLATKQRLLAAGLSVPWFAPVATPQALQRILIERGTDLLIGPADNRSVAMNPVKVKNLDAAFTSARRKSRTQRVMVEEKVTAQQMTVYAGVSAGRARALLLTPGSDAPGDPCIELHSLVGDLLLRAAAAIGLVDGPLRVDFAVEDANLSIVEVALQLPFGVPADQAEAFLDALIQFSVGEELAYSSASAVCAPTIA